MALDSAINTGSSTSGKANVDTGFNLNVTLPRTPAATSTGGVGFAALAGKNDDGTIVSGGRVNRAYVAEGNRLAVANPVLLWDDTFNATAQNTSKYLFGATTMTGSQAGGVLILNTSAITTINTNCAMRTFRSFPLFGKSELRCNTSGFLTTAPQANCTIEFGLLTFAAIPGAAAPTDGVFFRYNAAAELRGVISYNGTETQTAAITAPSANVNHDFVIVCQTNTVLFYIDDILVGVITLLTDAPTLGQPMIMASQPWGVRVVNGGSAPASATQLRISDVFITQVGADPNRGWESQKAGFGHMAYQGQNGGTMGSTGNFGNGALAAATALSNTAVAGGNPVGLGGYSHNTATLAAGTDGIVNSFQNPAGGVNQTPRNLVIRGVWIHTIVDAALTGGPLAFVYTLAYGHTAVSLATAEAASFLAGGTTKAPRRIPIGVEGCVVTATAGTLLSPGGVYRQFASPIVVAPGEFVAVVARQLGTVASAGSLVHMVGYDGYFE